jgi:hypothetical protein
MILSTFTEEQILAELIKDYAYIKRHTKKIADTYLRSIQKRGLFLREDDYDSFDIKTQLNNNWHVCIVYNQTKKNPWIFSACCIAEGAMKTRDYYLVRGLNTEEPYYVKITTHAIKRYKERNSLEERTGMYLSPEFIACHTFEHRETAICQRFIELKFDILLNKMENTDEIEDMSHIILTNRGIFYGLRTSKGNYTFKTYVSTKMAFEEVNNVIHKRNTKWEKEGRLIYYMLYAHQYYNKWLYDDDVLESFLYKEFGRDVEFKREDNSSIYLLRH